MLACISGCQGIRMITPNLYVLTLFKLALVATLTAIVGIGSWRIIRKTRNKTINKLVGYYIVVMLVIIWFLGMGWIATMS